MSRAANSTIGKAVERLRIWCGAALGFRKFVGEPALSSGRSRPGDTLELPHAQYSAVLADYGITSARLTLLKCSDKIIFQIDADRNEGTYAFHLYDPEIHDEISLNATIAWLYALQGNPNLLVPVIEPARSGTFVCHTTPPGKTGEWFGTLSRWIFADHERQVNEQFMEDLGEFMAHLHGQSSRCAAGEIARPRYDCSQVFGPHMEAKLRHIRPRCSRSEHTLLLNVFHRVRAWMAGAIQNRETFGMIHADLHPGNRLRVGRQIGALDFDDCGLGYFIYDIAVALSDHESHQQFPALVEACFRGYRRIRAVANSAVEELPVLLAASRLHRLTYLLKHADAPWARSALGELSGPLSRSLSAFAASTS